MKIFEKNYARVFNFILAALLLVLLATQFMPFFECASCEDGTASISEYVWFPSSHKDITNDTMKELYGKKFELGDIVITPVVILFACVLGAVFCIVKNSSGMIAIIPLIGGVVGLIGYLTQPGFQVNSSWTLHVALCGVITVLSLISISDPVVKAIKDQVEKEKAFKAN